MSSYLQKQADKIDELEREKETFCIDPKTVVNEQSTFALTEMFRSHHWAVEDGPAFDRGVIVRYRCTKCNSRGRAIVTPAD
jgi:hypothetical protein